MQTDNETVHEGWLIRTVVGYDNPEGWTKGDPDRYIVRGVAEFPPNGIDGFSFLSLDPLTDESEHFDVPAQAGIHHAKVTQKLQEAIDALRHPDW